MEIARSGADILLRLEEGDTVRTIHMQTAPPSDVPPSPLGYSVARLDGGDLVVRTTAINARYLNATGVPLSGAVTLDERFALAPDGSRLDYTLTITDPASFTAPLTIRSYRDWRPGVEVQRYSCTPPITVQR